MWSKNNDLSHQLLESCRDTCHFFAGQFRLVAQLFRPCSLPSLGPHGMKCCCSRIVSGVEDDASGLPREPITQCTIRVHILRHVFTVPGDDSVDDLWPVLWISAPWVVRCRKWTKLNTVLYCNFLRGSRAVIRRVLQRVT